MQFEPALRIRRRTVLGALAGVAAAPLANADEGFPVRAIRFVIVSEIPRLGDLIRRSGAKLD